MKMGKMAIEQMMDSFEDRIVDQYNEAHKKYIWNFPMMMAKEAKAIWEEITWMEEGGWITNEEAKNLWNHVEEACERFQRNWEMDMSEED